MTIKTARRSQSERRSQTRAAIIRAAYDAFEDQGSAEIALETIARGAGVTKGSIHYHFGNRAGLIKAVAVWAFQQLEARVNDSLAQPNSGTTAVHYVRALLHEQATPMGRLLFVIGDELGRSGDLDDIDPYRYLCDKLKRFGTSGSVAAVAAALTQFGRQLAYGLSERHEIDAMVDALRQGGQLRSVSERSRNL